MFTFKSAVYEIEKDICIWILLNFDQNYTQRKVSSIQRNVSLGIELFLLIYYWSDFHL